MNDDGDRAGLAVGAALVLAAATHAPLLALGGLFWDDWTWLHVFRTGGAAAVTDAMWQVAHPGYAPVFNAFFALGGEEPGRLARAVAIACHLLNGMLLWRILAAPAGRFAAATAAAIFLVSPWFTARGSLAHAQYDVFLACWLGSILLSARDGALARVTALVLLLAGLSLETLIALEPLRIVALRRGDESWVRAARRCAPFWIVCAAFAVLRATWLMPSGPYAGYNAIDLAPSAWLPPLVGHGRFLIRATTDAAAGALRLAGPIGLALAVAAGVAAALAASRRRRPSRIRLPVVAAAAAIVALGALPYALVGQWPTTAHFSSRFAFASQIGATILVAAALAALPWRRATAGAAAALVALLALAQLQNAKWMLFDEAVQQALGRALEAEFAAGPPRVAILRFEPSTRRVMYRRRCLSANDLNVARALADGGGGASFVYDADCLSPRDSPLLDPPLCTVSGLDRAPCPVLRVALVFALEPPHDDVSRTGLIELLRSRARIAGALRPG